MFRAFWPAPFLQATTLFLLTMVFLAYKYLTYNYGKWEKLGVPFAEPKLFFGSLGETIAGRMPLVDLVQAFYRRFDGKRYFGMYEAREASLVLRDPQLVHTVMVKDFGSFYDRIASNASFVHDKLFDHLVNVRGEQWKSTRAKLSPTFTAAKLKSMMTDINECTSRLIANLRGQVTTNNGTFFFELVYSFLFKMFHLICHLLFLYDEFTRSMSAQHTVMLIAICNIL